MPKLPNSLSNTTQIFESEVLPPAFQAVFSHVETSAQQVLAWHGSEVFSRTWKHSPHRWISSPSITTVKGKVKAPIWFRCQQRTTPFWTSSPQLEVLGSCHWPLQNTIPLFTWETPARMLVPWQGRRTTLPRWLCGSERPGCMQPSSTREVQEHLKLWILTAFHWIALPRYGLWRKVQVLFLLWTYIWTSPKFRIQHIFFTNLWLWELGQVMEPTSNCSSCSTTLIQESKSEPLVYSVRGSGSEPHCGCGPQDLLWYNNGTYGPTGEWDSSCNCTLGSLDGCTGCDNYHCQFGPNPQSGMGAVYPDGLRSPSGVLLSMLRSAQGSQRVKMSPSTVATLETKGVYPLAWHRKDNVALLMLSNPSANVIQALPSVAELIPSATRVFRATRLAQFSSESSNVSGLAGVDSTLPLLGKVVFAPEFKGPASKKLQDLQPYDVIKLWILFGGCSNRRYGIS